MNLSRRGFLKSLLATTALAPIAPVLVEAVEGIIPGRGFVDVITQHAIRPDALGNYYGVIHPSYVAEFKRNFEFYAGEQWGEAAANPLFEGTIGHIDGMPIVVDPVVDDLRDFGQAFFRDGEHIPALDVFEAPTTRRVTRGQLLTEGFTYPEAQA